MTRRVCVGCLIGLFLGCGAAAPPEPEVHEFPNLAAARAGFSTKLLRKVTQRGPVPQPPAGLFRVVRYPSGAGELAAYLGVTEKSAVNQPAVIWVGGGFRNDLSDTPWREPSSADADQSASGFRRAGLLTMYPSLRGGNDNPGSQECFYGEVDDILAAADFLAKQPQVDPTRVYLAGHSTGGTIALLAAASDTRRRFRAVFAFGPAHDVAGYGPDSLAFDLSNPKEFELRAPARWLYAITVPTFVFEGMAGGNIPSLNELKKASRNPLVHCHPLRGFHHVSILAPMTAFLAAKVVADSGPTCSITIADADLAAVPRP